MARAEQEGVPYLFRLRATANVKRALERAMAERDWSDAGQGWQGKETKLRLMGWSRQRRVVLLRRKFNRPLVLLDRTDPARTAAAGLTPPATVANWDANCCHVWSQLPDLGLSNDDDVIEMANLDKSHTGIDGVIGISTMMTGHPPRVKYFVRPGRTQPSFSVTIAHQPRVVTNSLPPRIVNHMSPLVI
jgi:hypothetical protein